MGSEGTSSADDMDKVVMGIGGDDLRDCRKYNQQYENHQKIEEIIVVDDEHLAHVSDKSKNSYKNNDNNSNNNNNNDISNNNNNNSNNNNNYSNNENSNNNNNNSNNNIYCKNKVSNHGINRFVPMFECLPYDALPVSLAAEKFSSFNDYSQREYSPSNIDKASPSSVSRMKASFDRDRMMPTRGYDVVPADKHVVKKQEVELLLDNNNDSLSPPPPPASAHPSFNIQNKRKLERETHSGQLNNSYHATATTNNNNNTSNINKSNNTANINQTHNAECPPKKYRFLTPLPPPPQTTPTTSTKTICTCHCGEEVKILRENVERINDFIMLRSSYKDEQMRRMKEQNGERLIAIEHVVDIFKGLIHEMK